MCAHVCMCVCKFNYQDILHYDHQRNGFDIIYIAVQINCNLEITYVLKTKKYIRLVTKIK
jgi:hypothetical protein